MPPRRAWPLACATALLLAGCHGLPVPSATRSGPPLTAAAVLESARPDDWRRPDPQNLLCLDLGKGRVVIELSPLLAPRHVANVRALVRERYFDGLAIVRVQDNYVVQWGDPDAGKPELARPIRTAQRQLPAELEFRLPPALPFHPLPDGDLYAPQAGFLDGMPIARDPQTGQCWPIHSYGMVGAGRDNALDSGGGAEMYVVSGQAPRHLDRNVTLFGRVLQGMDRLTSLPRGPGPMGFHEKPEDRPPIQSIRLASDLPEAERPRIEVLRTDTETFRRWVEARRNRREAWFHRAAGRIDVSNIPIPVR
ncbi:MAG: peptidylprolyl isomerase [Verrucomicrobiota bacterium]